jgi:DNA-binding NarL/FixJ family response regulator
VRPDDGGGVRNVLVTGPCPVGPEGRSRSRVRVLVAHPDPLVREPLVASMLRLNIECVIQAASPAEVRTAASAGAGDLVVIGTELLDGSHHDLLAELRGLDWPRVVVLVPPGAGGAAGSALRAGARGALAPTAEGRAVGAAAAGPPDPDPQAPRPARASGRRTMLDVAGTPQSVTGRERQILQLAADGHPNREIGEKLGLSTLTVKSHLNRIGRRLGTGDRAHLVLLALRAGAIV